MEFAPLARQALCQLGDKAYLRRSPPHVTLLISLTLLSPGQFANLGMLAVSL